jgi:hypothetical protein
MKGVLINLDSNCRNPTIYSGVTQSNIMGTTSFQITTGEPINIYPINPGLSEIYLKIFCVGCCEKIFKVNL